MMNYRTMIFICLLSGMQNVSAGKPVKTDPVFTRPEVITRCEAPVEFSDRYQYVGLGLTQQLPAGETLLLTLVRQPGQRYDVLAGVDSIGGEADFVKMDAAEGPVHLVLNTASGMEHFLFVLNQDGSGELLWSSATASALTTCTASI